MDRKAERSKRYGLLDTIRGITLLSMILYHGAWDMVYLYGRRWGWYTGTGAYLWQQSICWTFIFLSGFCWFLGRKPLRRGLFVFGGGLLVTAATLAAMPENRVVFGVLTLIGSCMLLMVPLQRVFSPAEPRVGFGVSLLLFAVTRNVNRGWLGFEGLRLLRLPRELYANLFTAYLGFPPEGFFSTDYFSLFPWLFLFLAGGFAYGMARGKGMFDRGFLRCEIKPFAFLGRHSLLIYLLHQPILYIVGRVCAGMGWL